MAHVIRTIFFGCLLPYCLISSEKKETKPIIQGKANTVSNTQQPASSQVTQKASEEEQKKREADAEKYAKMAAALSGKIGMESKL